MFVCLLTITKTKSVKADVFFNDTQNCFNNSILFLNSEDSGDSFLLYDRAYGTFSLTPLVQNSPPAVVVDYAQIAPLTGDRQFPTKLVLQASVNGFLSDNPMFSTFFSIYRNDVNVGQLFEIDYSSFGYALKYLSFNVSKSSLDNRPSVFITVYVYGFKLPYTSDTPLELIDTLVLKNYFDYWGSSVYNDFFDMLSRTDSWNALYATGSYGGTYSDGYQDGLQVAQTNAYIDGYKAGSLEQYGETAFKQVITSIVQSPVDFVQSVFNVDIFGFNVAGIIFAIISIAIAIFVLKIIFMFVGK